uniref:Uncharacterized protein n=1 Tax=Rhizophora mucronata TaxID=61149 RepID=A0A2P2P475_RHIMU
MSYIFNRGLFSTWLFLEITATPVSKLSPSNRSHFPAY